MESFYFSNFGISFWINTIFQIIVALGFGIWIYLTIWIYLVSLHFYLLLLSVPRSYFVFLCVFLLFSCEYFALGFLSQLPHSYGAPGVEFYGQHESHDHTVTALCFVPGKVSIDPCPPPAIIIPTPIVTGEVYCFPRRQLIFSFDRRVIHHSKGLRE